MKAMGPMNSSNDIDAFMSIAARLNLSISRKAPALPTSRTVYPSAILATTSVLRPTLGPFYDIGDIEFGIEEYF